MKKQGKSKVKSKELESSITGKFMEAVHGLGHDAEKLKKEIAKAGKAVSQKISSALKDDRKAAAKAESKKDKPAKKDGKKKETPKTEVKKADAKTEKVISKAAGKTAVVSSRSVPKPVVPAVHHSHATPDEKEEVKEASAPAPVKRTRAPRRTKEEIEASKNDEKTSVKEASAPVKRKRAPRKPKPAPVVEENQATETITSAVL